MEHIDYIILGAGMAGLGASYTLHQRGLKSVVFEKDDTYGGLCGNFEIEGFRFDRFVHFTFSNDKQVNDIFNDSVPEVYHHAPNAYNIYKGKWIKHPAQNNLFPLSEEEKDKIIKDFLNRKSVDDVNIENYEDWLRLQFGNYFAEHFPMVYTRKYWMREAHDLRTEWVGQRVYQPSVEEVIKGAQTADTPITYYTKEMRYPTKGGFKAFMKNLADVADIRYNKELCSINPDTKVVSFSDGNSYSYQRLFSSIPLPEMVRMTENVPEDVVAACKQLECTCGYHISIGLKTKNIPPYLWWYIYDEDILSARVHSPSMKSPDNAPDGCSSLQMEVYCEKGKLSEQEIVDKTVGKIICLGLINKEDILFVHLGYEQYANVIFTKPIYEARKKVREYFGSVGIDTIGRFGEWDYLWSDQSLKSGLNINPFMIHKFEFKETQLKGAYVIYPFFATDERGGFVKDYNIDMFHQNGIELELKEVFYTISRKGVIRATHFQLVKQQPKLVRCISGHVYDVIVDLRPESPTFGKWQGFDLTGENQKTLYVPAYFGHGYLVIEDSVVSYKCGEVFYGEGDSGIMYNDPDINIQWPLDKVGGIEHLIISEKDKNLMSFSGYKTLVGGGNL